MEYKVEHETTIVYRDSNGIMENQMETILTDYVGFSVDKGLGVL